MEFIQFQARQLAASASNDTDTFDLGWLQFKTLAHYPYLASDSFKILYFYHHKVGNKAFYGLFIPASKKALIFGLDTVRSNQMPNLSNMYNNERNSTNLSEGHKLPESEYTFEVKIENDVRQVYRQIQKALTTYKDEKRGKNRMLKEIIFFRIGIIIFIHFFRSHFDRCSGFHGFPNFD